MRTITILIAFIGITLLTWYFSRQAPPVQKEADVDVLIVGTNSEFPPFSYVDQEEITGFDIDIVKELAQRLEKRLQIKNMSFEGLIPEIQLGNIHIIAAGMTPTKERAQRVFFTKPHFDKDPLLVVQPIHAQKVNNAQDLIDKTVVVNQGYTADRYVSAIDGVEVSRISSPSISTGLLALKSEKADAYIAAHSSLQPYFEKHGKEEFHVTPLQDTEEFYALAISKKFPALYRKIQSILTQMEKDGTLKALRTKWGLGKKEPVPTPINKTRTSR